MIADSVNFFLFIGMLLIIVMPESEDGNNTVVKKYRVKSNYTY